MSALSPRPLKDRTWKRGPLRHPSLGQLYNALYKYYPDSRRHMRVHVWVYFHNNKNKDEKKELGELTLFKSDRNILHKLSALQVTKTKGSRLQSRRSCS